MSCGLDSRHHDGANQLGGDADYTGYLPVNPVDAIYDPNRWQPLATPAGTQQFLAPHRGLVQPFALTSLPCRRGEVGQQRVYAVYRLPVGSRRDLLVRNR